MQFGLCGKSTASASHTLFFSSSAARPPPLPLLRAVEATKAVLDHCVVWGQLRGLSFAVPMFSQSGGMGGGGRTIVTESPACHTMAQDPLRLLSH